MLVANPLSIEQARGTRAPSALATPAPEVTTNGAHMTETGADGGTSPVYTRTVPAARVDTSPDVGTTPTETATPTAYEE